MDKAALKSGSVLLSDKPPSLFKAEIWRLSSSLSQDATLGGAFRQLHGAPADKEAFADSGVSEIIDMLFDHLRLSKYRGYSNGWAAALGKSPVLASSDTHDVAFRKRMEAAIAALPLTDRAKVNERLRAFETLDAGVRERLIMEPDRTHRNAALRKMVETAEAGLRESQARQAEIQAQLRELGAEDYILEMLEGMIEWIGLAPVIEKPDQPLLPMLKNAFNGNRVLCNTSDKDIAVAVDPIPKDASIFLVAHDWAAAFSSASGLEGGAVRLPADNCCFEIQISGRRVIFYISAADGAAFNSNIFVSLRKNYWFSHDTENSPLRDDLEPVNRPDEMMAFVDVGLKQIRAVCIALDAEIAALTTERLPHFRNSLPSQRKLGDEYHVVSLAARRRYSLTGVSTGVHKKMHFVRGHWRNLARHKTWVKWHMRGDPDLGFIDKHYIA